jgi:uncharacterized Zn finger protein (UPF0148 family)
VKNEIFYASAATVIPLLLIAVMATRTLRVGEFSQQPGITVLAFGLPVIGELAAFAFLFFEPVPTAAAVILALLTWVGLLSQLALAAWWLAELIRREEAGREKKPQHEAPAPFPRRRCPACSGVLEENDLFCARCGSPVNDALAKMAHEEEPVPQQAAAELHQEAAAPPEETAEALQPGQSSATAPAARQDFLARLTRTLRDSSCPMCGMYLREGTTFCNGCGRYANPPPGSNRPGAPGEPGRPT